jgi:hypothetical protein
MMTVGDVIDMLEYYDRNTEIRLATQPSWPLEYAIGYSTSMSDDGIVYIAESDQIGYLPGEVAADFGWR